jgi:hypothetical protein
MSLSYNQYTDLSTDTFAFTFGFIDINDVLAIGLRTSDDKWIPLTITARSASAKTVTVSDDLTPYSKVQVYRKTTVAPIVDFQDGSRLTERDLDAAYRQGLYVAQEVAENSNQSTQREDVDTDIIADNAVTTPKIADHNVTDQKLSLTLDLSSHSVELATGEISTRELANDAVDGTKLADDAVDGTKMADDAVDSEHLVDGSVDNVHLAGGIDLTTKVTGTLPSANGGTGVTTAIPFTVKAEGEVEIAAAGTATTFSHGLGNIIPELFKVYLKCTNSANGYAVGDVIDFVSDSNGTSPISVYADSVNALIGVQFENTITVANKSNGAAGDITLANFKFLFKVYN